MTTKAELLQWLTTAKNVPGCGCTICEVWRTQILKKIEQLPDTPNPLEGIELYAQPPVGRNVIGIRPPKIGEYYLPYDGTAVNLCTIHFSGGEIRLILAPLPPPKTWACPGLKDKAYEVSVDGVQFTYNTWLPWSDIAIINAKLTKPEHFGVYDVVNEVGTLREGGRS